MRIAFLGPAGTFSDEALRAAHPEPFEAAPVATLRDAVSAVRDGAADRAFVPIENALEGAVDQTLDALAEMAPTVRISGERVHPIRTCLIARRPDTPLDAIELVLSHPQPLGQCARFLREALPRAATRATASTAEAVREVAAARTPWAALAPRRAAAAHGCAVLRDGVDDSPGNTTRFVWIDPRSSREREEGRSGFAHPAGEHWRASLAFAGAGDATSGWLVACLREFSERGLNLSRIESRPLRTRLGHYRFFVDVDVDPGGDAMDDAIAALAAHCDDVRVLGFYRAGSGSTG